MNIATSLFLTGLLFGWGPCLVSCGPILLSYTVGTNKDVPRGLKDYLVFSLARFSVYVVLVLVAYFLGSFTLKRLLGKYAPYAFILGGGFIVLVGFFMMFGKRLELGLGRFFQKNMTRYNKQNLIMMGLIFGFLPCMPLLAILSYIGLISKAWFHSLLYVFSFGLGTFLSPLIPLIILTGFMPKFVLSRQAAYARILRFICGLIILFLGTQLVSRGFSSNAQVFF